MTCKSIMSLSVLGAAVWCGGVATRDAEAAGLLVADGGFGGVLEIREHVVNVTVNNGVVVTTVDQVFFNTESRQIEALYTFPVPKGASVSNFSMWIGGAEMVGEVVEKKRAREIYDSYKARRVDPGLLEQVDYRTFEMRVFPIGPKAEQRVRITYSQELDFDNNLATYVYPLATSTRPGVNSRVTGKFAMNVDVRSEIPLTSLASESHPDAFAVVEHGPTYRQASLEARGGDLSRDVVLSFEMQRPRTGLDLVTSRTDGEDGYFQLTLTAGEELSGINPPMDYVFLIDVSGSMQGDGKLSTSTSTIAEFVRLLGPEDRFEIIAFNVQPQTAFGQLTPAAAASVAQAEAFLGSQKAMGGTVLASAMGAAYRYAAPDRALNVVVLSDGLTEQRESAELTRLIGQRPQKTRVFTIGVGNDVNRPLLERMAEGSGGLSAFVSGDDNLQRQAAGLRRKLMRPAAKYPRAIRAGWSV